MNRLKGALYLSCASAVWGGMCVVGKYTTTSVPPLTLVLMRFLVASLVLSVVVHRNGLKRLNPRDIPRVMAIGFVGCTVSIGTQFMGIHWSSAHMAAVLTATTPIFIALMAPTFLRERVRPNDVLSLVIASVGMLLTTVPGDQSAAGGSVVGNVLLVIAAATWGLYSVLAKPLNAKYGADVIVFWALLFGTLFLLPFTALEVFVSGLTLPHTSTEWFGVLYLGVFSTAIAFYCWNKGFELIQAQVAGLFQFVQPIIGSILALVILREQLQLTFLYGSLLILLGVALSLLGSTIRLQKPRQFGGLGQQTNRPDAAEIEDGYSR